MGHDLSLPDECSHPRARKSSFGRRIAEGLRRAGLALAVLLMPAATRAQQSVDHPDAVVAKPVVNMYRGPSAASDVVSQALYGAGVFTLGKQPSWINVRTADGYTGWVAASDLKPLNGGSLMRLRVKRSASRSSVPTSTASLTSRCMRPFSSFPGRRVSKQFPTLRRTPNAGFRFVLSMARRPGCSALTLPAISRLSASARCLRCRFRPWRSWLFVVGDFGGTPLTALILARSQVREPNRGATIRWQRTSA